MFGTSTGSDGMFVCECVSLSCPGLVQGVMVCLCVSVSLSCLGLVQGVMECLCVSV